jgi:hypothetical protein
VVLLPGALQQRLIRRLLNQGMLEEVRGLRRDTAAIEQLGVHELL